MTLGLFCSDSYCFICFCLFFSFSEPVWTPWKARCAVHMSVVSQRRGRRACQLILRLVFVRDVRLAGDRCAPGQMARALLLCASKSARAQLATSVL